MNDVVVSNGNDGAAAAASPAPGGDTPASESNEFEGLFSFETEGGTPSASEPKSSQQQSDGAAQQQPAAQPGTDGQQQPAQPAAQPQTQVPDGQQQQPAAGNQQQQPASQAQPGQAQPDDSQQQQPQFTPEQLSEMRTGFVNEQVKTFEPMMTDEFLTELQDSPQTAFPKMAAEVIARVHDMFIPLVNQMILHSVPNLVESTVQQNQAQADGTKRFFDAFPELNTKDMHDIVKRVGTTYRQANPQATAEQFMKDVGASSWVAGGLDVALLQERLRALSNGGPQQPQQQPAQQSTAPFRPAAPGGGSEQGQQQQSPQGNEFELLTEEQLKLG